MAFTMIYNGEETIGAARGVKGDDYVRLFDDEDNVVFEATGVSDFSVFEVTEGDWGLPGTVNVSTIKADTMFYNGTIVVSLPLSVKVVEGLILTFVAPCNCSDASKLQVGGSSYTIVDAMGNVMTGGSGVWRTGSLITVVLGVGEKKAYLQNPAFPEKEEVVELYEELTYEGTGKITSNGQQALGVGFSFRPKIFSILGSNGDNCVFVVPPANQLRNTTGTFLVTESTTPTSNVATIVKVGFTVSSANRATLKTEITVATNNDTPRYIFNKSGVTYYVTAIG